MTREEAKQASDWFRNRSKAVTMPGAKRMCLLAIEALSAQPEIMQDGTLSITIEDASQIRRVLISQSDTQYGTLYYADGGE